MFRRSDGSAVAGFALIAGPLLLSFYLVMQVVAIGHHKVLLTDLANSAATKFALADAQADEVNDYVSNQLSVLGFENTAISLSADSFGAASIRTARLLSIEPFGIEIEAVGYAVAEIQ